MFAPEWVTRGLTVSTGEPGVKSKPETQGHPTPI